jgi:hypothetical protein
MPTSQLFESLLNPQLNITLQTLDPEKLRRRRDIKTLRRVLQTIHWPTIQGHIEEAPHIIRSRVFYFWEEFNSVVHSPMFQLLTFYIIVDSAPFNSIFGLQRTGELDSIGLRNALLPITDDKLDGEVHLRSISLTQVRHADGALGARQVQFGLKLRF